MRSISTLACLLVVTSLALSACSQKPRDSAYLNRGGPESLLDVSSEVVNLGTGTASELQDLSSWISKDQPTRAELRCSPGEKRCNEAQKLLQLHGVPFDLAASGESSVTLIYERILARDCNQRFVDNVTDDYNAPHPAFGCSISANMVQHVTNKQEFISPNLSDDPSAVRSVGDIRNANTPREIVAPYSVNEAQTAKAGNQ
ncbi:MAG: hypothetical protein V4735_04235 [Pseudomonadota bacterium]